MCKIGIQYKSTYPSTFFLIVVPFFSYPSTYFLAPALFKASNINTFRLSIYIIYIVVVIYIN